LLILKGREEALMDISLESLCGCDVSFLPIAAAFVKRIGIAEEVNRLCGGQSDVSSGLVVEAMVLDTLRGRSPLYRLEDSFAEMDLELLLGEDIPASKLNDDAVGRSLDRMYDVGTGKILTAIAIRTVKLFNLETCYTHQDTTSITLYGDYDLYGDPDCQHPFVITYGFNKDHRPDLKQLVHSLLCVDHGIPIFSKCYDGNKSDKKINQDIMGCIVDRMRDMGCRNPLYVADSAVVTEESLDLAADEEKGFRLVSRLPASYKECFHAIARAVEADEWEDLGELAQQSSSGKRKVAHYHGFETELTLYGRSYRGLVIHSSAHDERKMKKLRRLLKEDLDTITKTKADHEKIEDACLPDAKAAISRIPKGKFHQLTAEVQELPKYGRGRPRADGTRTVERVAYKLRLSVERNEQAIAKAEKEAGCFVLVTNASAEGEDGISSKKLLTIYKEQDTVERNFGFLKDHAIVNALFLKTPARLEALGLILIIALMVWRLMERTMRVTLKESDSTIIGWEKRQTSRPTSFMMRIKFQSVLVLRTDSGRFLGKPLNSVQLAYLKILGLPPEIFTEPYDRLANRLKAASATWSPSG
jgi:transposase